MKKALENEELRVVLQPQCDLTSGSHKGFEALVRWKLGRKWIAPQEIISIAEDADLISQVGYQIIDKALTIFARLKAAGLQPGSIGLNVVAAQLHDPVFVKTVSRLAARHGVQPSEIEIEVTENVILDRSGGSIARTLKRLRSQGMSIALDDFGMGYASLKHLKRFPLDRLKIDCSFVAGMLQDFDDHAIVRTVISLAHNLGLRVVAEGVETAEQLNELYLLGCDTVQGYLIGRPMDESEAADFCRMGSLYCTIGTP